MYTFSDWYKTPWDKINVDVLIEETKKLAKDVKTLNKAVRNYEVFRLLEESLKAMLTSLPLVQVRWLLLGGALEETASAWCMQGRPGWCLLRTDGLLNMVAAVLPTLCRTCTTRPCGTATGRC
jgi:hypothetical protein